MYARPALASLTGFLWGNAGGGCGRRIQWKPAPQECVATVQHPASPRAAPGLLQVPAAVRNSQAVVLIASSRPATPFPQPHHTVGHAASVWPGIKQEELVQAVAPVGTAAVLLLRYEQPACRGVRLHACASVPRCMRLHACWAGLQPACLPAPGPCLDCRLARLLTCCWGTAPPAPLLASLLACACRFLRPVCASLAQ